MGKTERDDERGRLDKDRDRSRHGKDDRNRQEDRGLGGGGGILGVKGKLDRSHEELREVRSSRTEKEKEEVPAKRQERDDNRGPKPDGGSEKMWEKRSEDDKEGRKRSDENKSRGSTPHE